MKEIYGKYSDDCKLADLHIHTDRTDGVLSPYQTVELAQHIGLQAIAITDHDTIISSEVAKNYAAIHNYPLEVIVGEEITTREGHIIGLYLKDTVRKGLSVEQTIYEIHRQNGLAVIPHPDYKRVRSLTKEKIYEMIQKNDEELKIDGIEIFNAGVFLLSQRKILKNHKPSFVNEQAQELYSKFSEKLGAPVGGSDNHRITLGNALTGYKNNLEKDLKEGTTIVLALDFEEMADNFGISKQFFGSKILQKERSRHRF